MWILSPEFNFIWKIITCIKAASYEDSHLRPKLNRWAINNPCTLCAQSCDYNCSCIHSWRISHHLLTKDPGHHSGLGICHRVEMCFVCALRMHGRDFLWGHTNESAGPPVSAAASVCSVSLVIFGDIAQWWHVFHISPQALWSAGWRVGGGARQEWEGMDPERQTKAGSEEFCEHLGFCLISGSCKANNHHYYNVLQIKLVLLWPY